MEKFKGPLYEGIGIFKYEPNYKAALHIDQEILNYYKSLIPKYFHVNKPRWSAHITVIRNETPINVDLWGKYEGKEINFSYSPIIHYDKIYYWLNAFSRDLEQIRTELGLPVFSQYTLPPEGYLKCFHITIGNNK